MNPATKSAAFATCTDLQQRSGKICNNGQSDSRYLGVLPDSFTEFPMPLSRRWKRSSSSRRLPLHRLLGVSINGPAIARCGEHSGGWIACSTVHSSSLPLEPDALRLATAAAACARRNSQVPISAAFPKGAAGQPHPGLGLNDCLAKPFNRTAGADQIAVLRPQALILAPVPSGDLRRLPAVPHATRRLKGGKEFYI